MIISMKQGELRKAERESDLHPISLKTPAPQYQPLDRKKKKGQKKQTIKRDRAD